MKKEDVKIGKAYLDKLHGGVARFEGIFDSPHKETFPEGVAIMTPISGFEIMTCHTKMDEEAHPMLKEGTFGFDARLFYDNFEEDED